jgi:hypothetical protein
MRNAFIVRIHGEEACDRMFNFANTWRERWLGSELFLSRR